MGVMNTEQLITQLEASRAWFLKLVEGLTPEQWDAKPYPNVMSPRETLAHLIVDDRVFPLMLEGHGEPDYESFRPDPSASVEELMALMGETHKAKIERVRAFLTGKDLSAEIDAVYAGKQPLWWEVVSFTTEDWYHIGQVSAIRQGTDPDFDYYATFY